MLSGRIIFGSFVAFLIGCLILAGIAELTLRVIYPQWGDFSVNRFVQTEYVPDYGVVYTGRPGFDGYFAQNNGDFRAHIRINDAGLRNDEPVTAADNRIWLLGDSMTFGWGVEREEMYSSQLNDMLPIQTYNVASPGTDVCGYEALTKRMPNDVKPAGVVVGLILENDILSYDCQAKPNEIGTDEDWMPSLTWLKGALTSRSALYNFLSVSVKRVDVLREGLIAIGAINREHAYRSLPSEEQVRKNIDSTANELQRLRSLYDLKTPFLIAVIPSRFEIINGDQAFKLLRLEMLAALEARGLPALDLFPAFSQYPLLETHFAHDGHWSPRGHQLAAETISTAFAPQLP